IELTNHLVEGSELAAGGDGASGGLASSPLLKGASGRLWVSADGRMRLELQAEQGDTQILYDGHTVSAYDAPSNTIYRYTPKLTSDGSAGSENDQLGTGRPEVETAGSDDANEPVPSVAKIEEALSEARKHANVSEGTATDVSGRPAYTVRV